MNTTQNAVEKYTGGHFDSGIKKPHENILGIKNSTSHTQLGCYSISSPFFSPNATFNAHLHSETLHGSEHLVATPIPHPTSQPKSLVFQNASLPV